MLETYKPDIIIVGAGNAAFSAAIAARENGSEVLMLEKTEEKYMGGNSALTIHMRFAYNSFDDLLPLIKFPESSFFVGQ
jgi:tricarballylate dehydrogenase